MVNVMLREWASDAALTFASFFFHNLGSAEQKSHDGLSRAFLYNVLLYRAYE